MSEPNKTTMNPTNSTKTSIPLPKGFVYLGFGGTFKRIKGDLYGHSLFPGAALFNNQWVLGEYIGWDNKIEYAAIEDSDITKCQTPNSNYDIDFDPSVHHNARVNLSGERYNKLNTTQGS